MAADRPDFGAYAAESVPQMAVGSPGKTGELALRFAADGEGTTRLVHDFARVPFHVSGTLEHDPHPDVATVVVQSTTGGVAQGDRLHTSVDVETDAVATVTTQGSTKVQSMDANYAESAVELAVADGGHLDYVPGPTILYSDARYRQTVSLELAKASSAVLWDVTVSGRLARGERFDFDRYHGRVRARSAEELLFEDAAEMCPDAADPAAEGVVGDWSVVGTCYVVAPWRDTTALTDAVHDRVVDGDGRAGVTRLPNDAGVVVRALGDQVATVRAVLRAAWDVARRDILDTPAPQGRRY